MRISVLDQSPIIENLCCSDAIHETIKLAKVAEALGFYRYWLAEHHNMKGLADPCPEILLPMIGAATKRIRIGTGGVLLPYYSPLKVAETFNMLEILFPQRIDLGIGRAPGGDRLTADALNAQALADINSFPEKVVETISWLDNKIPDKYAFGEIKAMPKSPTSPEIWLLGSSNFSSSLASHLGLRFAFAHFISAKGGEDASKTYRREFIKSTKEREPYNMVCISVICAKTQEEAEILAAPLDHRRLLMATGEETPLQTTESSRSNQYSEFQKEAVKQNRTRSIIGCPKYVKEKLETIKNDFCADEVMILTITGGYQERIESYELIASSFGL